MNSSLLERAKAFLQAQRKKNIWYRLTTGMAAVVVFITTYMLILPAITMERDTICGLEEHTHVQECYAESGELLCGKAEHTHTDNCYPASAEDQQDVILDEAQAGSGAAVSVSADSSSPAEPFLVAVEEVADPGLASLDEIPEAEILQSDTETEAGDAELEKAVAGSGETELEEAATGSGETELEEAATGSGKTELEEAATETSAVEYICRLEEHHHTELCYAENEAGELELTCEKEEHVHDDSCVQQEVRVETETETESETVTETEAETEIESETMTETEAETAAESETMTETEAEPATESETMTETDTETAIESETMTETDAKLESESAKETEQATETETETESVTETEAETKSETELETVAETESETEQITEAAGESETATETETEMESDTELVTETEMETEPVTEAETESATEKVSEAQMGGLFSEIETESGSETESETEAMTETETESETEVTAETETESDTEFSSESETESEVESESETETESEFESELVSEAEAESESETEIAVETESETETEVETETESESESESEMERTADNYQYMTGSSWCTVQKDQSSETTAAAGKRRLRALRAGISPLAENGGTRAAGTGVDFGVYVTSTSIAKMEGGVWRESTSFTDGDQVRVQINYSLPSGKVDQNNNTIYYQLPNGVSPNKEESGTVYNMGVAVGTYNIGTNGLIEIVFNDSFANGESFRGSIFFEGNVTMSGTGDEGKIEFGGTGSTITVIKDTAKNDIRTEKKGEIVTKDTSGATLKYTITASTTLGTDGTVSIKDQFNESNANVSYDKEKGFKLVKVNTDGTKVQMDMSAYTPVWGVDDRSFQIDGLPELYPNEKYELEYYVNADVISSDGSCNVCNSAASGYKDKWSWAWNNVEISKAMLKKEGWYDKDKDEITWKITVNEGGGDIGGFVLKDILPAGLEIKGEVTIKDGNWTTLGTVSPTPGQEFSYTFPDGSTGTRYVEFTTTAGTTAGIVRNEVNLTEPGKNEPSFSGGGTANVEHRDWDLGKWFNGEEKKNGKQYYKWRSEVTLPYGPFSEFTYTDTILDGSREAVTTSGGTNHYATAAELQARIAETLCLIDNSGTTLNYEAAQQHVNFELICYDAEKNQVQTTDSVTHVVKYELKVTPKETDFVGRKLTFEYSTIVDYSGMAEGETWWFANSASIPDHTETETARGEHTNPKTFSKQAGFDYDSWKQFYNGNISVDLDQVQGKFVYRLILHTKKDQNGDLTVTDFLPKGMTFENKVEGDFYNNDYSIYPQEGDYNFDGEQKVTVQQDPQPDGTTKLTMTIKGGYNNGLSQDADSGRAIQLLYWASMKDDTIWDDLKTESHTYTNRAEWDGHTASQSTEVTRKVDKVTKKAVQLDENGDPYEVRLDVQGNPVEGAPKPSNKVKYTVTINPGGADLDPYHDYLILTDKLTEGQKDAYLLLDELKLYQYDSTKEGSLGDPIDTSQYKVFYNEETRQMTIRLADRLACVLVYEYQFTANSGLNTLNVKNQVSLSGIYKYETNTKVETSTSGADVERKKAKVQVYKVDSDDYSMLLQGAEFKLERRTESKNEDGSKTYDWEEVRLDYSVTDKAGEIELNQVKDPQSTENLKNQVLHKNVLYRLTETVAPTGYGMAEEPYYFLCMEPLENKTSVTKDDIWTALGGEAYFHDEETALAKEDIRFFQESGGKIYVPDEYAGIGVRKVWVNEKGSVVKGEGEITVVLYQRTVREDPADTVNLHVRIQSQSNPAEFQEKNYKIARDAEGSFTLGSWHNSELGQLLTVSSSDCETSLSMPGADSDGYWGTAVCKVSRFSKDTCSITVLTSNVGNAAGNVQFTGDAPGVLVEDKEYDRVTLNKGNNNQWTHSWGELPAKNEQGEDVCYVVREENPNPNCVVSYSDESGILNGLITITNTWIAKPNELTIRKEWDDQEISAEHTEIEVEVYEKDSGRLVTTVKLNDANGWIARVTELTEGKTYYVKEKTPGGYQVSYQYNGQTYLAEHASDMSATAGAAITVKNTRQTTEVRANKKWTLTADQNAQELTDTELAAWGLSDAILTLHLYGTTEDIASKEAQQQSDYFEDGILKEEYRHYDGGTVRISKANNWKGIWKKLPAADEAGNPYFYYVVEENYSGERLAYDDVYFDNGTKGTSGNGKEVTVANVLDDTFVKVEKKWLGLKGEELTEHPDSVQVQLYRTLDEGSSLADLTDDKKVGNPVTFGGTSEADWSYTWENLPWKNEAGQTYYYYIKEVRGDGTEEYKPIYHGNGVMSGTIQLDNVKIAETDITIEKKWLDGNGQSFTPENMEPIRVRLYRKSHVGSYADNFVEVKLKVKYIDGNQEYMNQTLHVRKNSRLSFAWDSVCNHKACTVDGGSVSMDGSDKSFILGLNRDMTVEVTINVSDLTHTIIGPDEGWELDGTVGEYELSSQSGWSKKADHLPKEGVNSEGEVVSYLYYMEEISAPEGYKTSYSNNDGVIDGTVTVTNTQFATTEITLEKKWINGKGESFDPSKDTEDPISEIEVGLWQAELPGSYAENFVELDVDLDNETDPWTEVLHVRKGTQVKIEWDHANTRSCVVNGEGQTLNETGSLTIPIDKDTKITGYLTHNGGTCKMTHTLIEPAGDLEKHPFENRRYKISAADNWKVVVSNLPKEGLKDGQLVSYVYGISEINTPEGYTVSYSRAGGAIDGTVTVVNKKEDTQIEVVKKWQDKTGASVQPENCESIQVELWRAELAGNFDDLYVTMKLDLKQWGHVAKDEKYIIRKNSLVTLKLEGVETLTIGNQVSTVEPDDKWVYTHQFRVTEDIKVAANVEANVKVISMDITSPESNLSNAERIKTRTLSKPAGAEASDSWTTVFEGLPKTGMRDGNPVTYVYYVRENGCPNNYLTSYENNEGIPAGTITVTNKEVDVETTEITVNKQWQDQEGSTIPADVESIKLNLYQAEVDPGITVKFDIRAGYNADAKPINSGQMSCARVAAGTSLKFSIKCSWGNEYYHAENVAQMLAQTVGCRYLGMSADYRTFSFELDNVSQDIMLNYVIADNTPTDWTLNVEKYEQDTNIQLNNPVLYREGIEVRPDANGNWSYQISDLPKSIDYNGKVIHYRYYIEETPVPDGYTCTIENNAGIDTGTITITNKKNEETPKVTSLIVWKLWQDSAGEGKDVSSGTVKFKLMQRNTLAENGGEWKQYRSQENDGYYSITNGGTIWEKTIDDLPLSGKDMTTGESYAYVYSVQEISVDDKPATEKFIISYSPNEAEDGKNGVSEGTITITNKDKQTYVLPETGGPGTQPYTLGGIVLTAVSLLLIGIKNKRRKEEQGSS